MAERSDESQPDRHGVDGAMPVAAAPGPAAITGLILAGGAGRRMGGADKGLMSYAGQTLIEWVWARFAPQVGALLISANRSQERYAALGAPVIGDDLPGFQGPLAGLAAALRHCTTPFLACVPCDAPNLPLDLVAHLAAGLAAADRAPAAVAGVAGRRQPTFLLCHRSLRTALDDHLAAGGRCFDAWLDEIGAVEVGFADAAAFINVNTLQELVCAARAGDVGATNSS